MIVKGIEISQSEAEELMRRFAPIFIDRYREVFWANVNFRHEMEMFMDNNTRERVEALFQMILLNEAHNQKPPSGPGDFPPEEEEDDDEEEIAWQN